MTVCLMLVRLISVCLMDGLPTMSAHLMTKTLNVSVSSSLTMRVREGETCALQGDGGEHELVRLG